MVRIQEPFHGAILNRRHGKQTDKGLTITVRGEAPTGDRVVVNGTEARRDGPAYAADVTLSARESDIVTVSTGVNGRGEHRVRVVWDRFSKPRYRFSIDDNSFFMRDLYTSKPKSLFDCFYLRLLKNLNRKYGAKFVLNLFHTTPEHDFNLTQFPDSYRAEWADNAAWLKLSFHSFCEFPDRPYQYAPAAKLAADYDLVAGEIVRFAGEETWAAPTVIHWGMLPQSSLPVLAQRGVKVLSGFFRPSTGSGYTTDAETPGRAYHLGYDVNYMLDERRSNHVFHHEAVKDFASGVVFSRVDIVCNNTPVPQVVPTLEPLTRDPNLAEVMDLFTHEQYFWPFYRNHRPDHADRCEAAIRFCAEQGYEPVFFHEGLMGGAE